MHITDIGIGYISTMLALHTLYLRWCTQIRDFGLQHICGMRSMQILSLAGKFYDESLRLWNSTCCNIHIKSRCNSKKLADVIPTYVNGRAPNCIITCMHIGIALFLFRFLVETGIFRFISSFMEHTHAILYSIRNSINQIVVRRI